MEHSKGSLAKENKYGTKKPKKKQIEINKTAKKLTKVTVKVYINTNVQITTWTTLAWRHSLQKKTWTWFQHYQNAFSSSY